MRLTVRAVVKTGYQKIKGSKFLMRSPTENCHENRKMPYQVKTMQVRVAAKTMIC